MQFFVLMKVMDIIGIDVKRALSSPEQPDLFPPRSSCFLSEGVPLLRA